MYFGLSYSTFSDKLSFEQKKLFKWIIGLNQYYIKIRTILEIDPKIIHEELVTALELSVLSYTTVIRWAKCFREGRENVSDHPLSVSPVSEFTGENIELVRQIISK